MKGAAPVLPSASKMPNSKIETTIGIKYHFLLCLMNITSSHKKLGFFLNSFCGFMLPPLLSQLSHQRKIFFDLSPNDQNCL
jgi:hypothetical protein